MFDFKVTNILEGKPADIIAKDAMLDIQDVQYYKGFRNIAIHLSGNRPIILSLPDTTSDEQLQQEINQLITKHLTIYFQKRVNKAFLKSIGKAPYYKYDPWTITHWGTVRPYEKDENDDEESDCEISSY